MNTDEFNPEDLEQAVAQAVNVMSQFLGLDEQQERHAPPSPREQKIVELESVLANASFAHEYALMHLDKIDNERERDGALEELERYHGTYAEARKLLEEIDRDRLVQFETSLAWQKSAILRGYHV